MAHSESDMTAPSAVPLCSRAANHDRDTAEVRLDLPMSLIAVLDFLAAREGTTRKALIEKFTRAALQDRLMDARMLVRMAESNTSSAD